MIQLRRLFEILLAALAFSAQPLPAQAPDQGVSISESIDQALQPLAAEEMDQAVSTLRADDGAAMRLGADQRVRTVSVERHEEDKGSPSGQRRADVVLYNYDTGETVSAIVTLGPTPVVEELAVSPEQPGGLGAEEVEEARQQALSHPAVQEELRARGLVGRERDLIITHIRVQTDAPDDPCSTDRCVLLSFNTPDAVLDIQPIVNLTTGQVEVQ